MSNPMLDAKYQHELLAQLGTNAAAAAAAAASTLAITQMVSAQSGDPIVANAQDPLVINTGGQLQGGRYLRLRVGTDEKGLTILESNVAPGDQLPFVGVAADGNSLELAVMREGDVVRVYGTNAMLSASGRCFIKNIKALFL